MIFGGRARARADNVLLQDNLHAIDFPVGSWAASGGGKPLRDRSCGPVARTRGIVGRTCTCPLLFILVHFLFEFLISFSSSLLLGRNPILSRAGLVPF